MFAGFEQPVDEVLATVSAGRFGNDGYGEVDLAAGGVQFLGDLPTGLAGADYEHGPRRELRRIAVVVGMQLGQAGRELGGQSRDLGNLVGARCQDNVPCGQVPKWVLRRKPPSDPAASR